MRLRKITELILVLSFFLLACAPFLAGFFDQELGSASGEKRAMAERPEIGLIRDSFPEYSTRYERYYSDSFPLRNQLIRWNNLIRLKVFGESPIRGVRLGREGWLFYADEWVFEDYENIMPFSPENLAKIRTVLDQRRIWLAKRGIHFLVVVPPNTQTIYPEYLPPGVHKIGKESRYDQVAQYLKPYHEIEFLDLRSPLLRAKPTQRLYQRTDSHWNDYGAFVGYQALVDRISDRLPNVRRLSLEDFTVSTVRGEGGDLAGMLSLSDLITEERIVLTPKFHPRSVDVSRDYPDPVDEPGREMVVKETRDTSLPKALVFRDSYSWGLIPYLSESFQSVVYLWTFDFLPEIIEREKPDVVIFECVERYLNALMRDNPEEVRGAGGTSGWK